MKIRFLVFGSLGVLVLLLLAWSINGRALPLAMHTLHADDAQLESSRALGAQYIVQVFAWSEIEPTQGEFHWEYTDWLVRAAEYYHLRVVARLDKPPEWATSVATPYSAPPNHLQDYGDFVAEVAARYQGRIPAYIIWNEPNLSREWGNQTPDPVAYTALLRTASARLRAADSHALIVSAGLAPNNEHTPQALDDRDFMRAMYAAGAAGAFDVLAAHPYPFALPPGDSGGAHDGLNFERVQDLRDIMVANGDTAKPIWITEFGYLTEASAGTASQQVSQAQQAEWLAGAYELARAEMPFVELFTVWNLSPTGATPDEAAYSILNADGSPKPAYASIRTMPKSSLASSIATDVQSLVSPPPAAFTFPILARDAIIHLGDGEYPAPWVPLYRTLKPSVEWNGEFYLHNADLQSAVRGQPWTLTFELMQISTLDARILVNDQPANPPFLPTEDFTSVWVSAQFQVPVNLLHAGHNMVTVRTADSIPAFQQLGSWDDLQLRHVVLLKPGSADSLFSK